MNKKISANEFRESLDRHVSYLKANPWLAQSIIASEMKGETKVKRKLTTSVIIALLMILTLGTVAYGVTSLWRTVSWQGEETNIGEMTIEVMPEENVPLYNKMLDYMDSVEDNEIARAWFDNGNETSPWNSMQKPMKKHFNCAEDFLDYMSGVSTLTSPLRFPEGKYESFEANVSMVCRDTGKYELIESGEKDSVHYSRFRMDEADAVPCEYYIRITMKDGTCYIIQSCLLPEAREAATGLDEGETAESITVRGMDDALLIHRQDETVYDVIMRRKLSEPIGWKQISGTEAPFEEETGFFTEENVVIWGPGDVDPAELVKLFDGE